MGPVAIIKQPEALCRDHRRHNCFNQTDLYLCFNAMPDHPESLVIFKCQSSNVAKLDIQTKNTEAKVDLVQQMTEYIYGKIREEYGDQIIEYGDIQVPDIYVQYRTFVFSENDVYQLYYFSALPTAMFNHDSLKNFLPLEMQMDLKD